MTSAGTLYSFLILLFGPILMTFSQPASAQPAEPLRGPDFMLEKVTSWVERPGADAELILRDGSSWKLKPGTKLYGAQRDSIVRAMQRDNELFLSGDKSRGVVELVLGTRHLAVQEIGDKDANGHYSVVFYGPPSIYHLRIDRPWAQEALSLLRRSASSGAFFDSPDLLVAIDPGTSEVVAVRPLASGKATTTR